MHEINACLRVTRRKTAIDVGRRMLIDLIGHLGRSRDEKDLEKALLGRAIDWGPLKRHLPQALSERAAFLKVDLFWGRYRNSSAESISHV